MYGGESKLIVEGYTDASFQTNKDDSTTDASFHLLSKWRDSELKKFKAKHCC